LTDLVKSSNTQSDKTRELLEKSVGHNYEM